ncbi:MAG: 2-dehydropantoate 2-reductase [Nocardiopsaceae bacterium]|nr:2-dehydropantoate 2-reductase [Nocardiopsaceae bacterium]
MRICVVGAGAVGGLIAAALARVNPETSVLARGVTLAAIRERGLRVESASFASSAAVTASDDGAELGEQDVVILAVKAQSVPGALAAIKPLLGPDTAVAPTLNGVPWWFFEGGFGGPCAGMHLASVDPGGAISSVMPINRVIGGVVHLSASSPAPGVVRHASGNGIIIGEPSGAGTIRLKRLADVLVAAGLDVTVSPNIREDVWYKLWGNVTMNPVSALTGASVGPLLDDDLVSAFCESAMGEAREIGDRIGCPISQTPAERSAVARKLGDFRPSMLQDAEAGRTLELDALTGAVREIGAAVGVPTPFTDALHGLTRLAARVRGLS